MFRRSPLSIHHPLFFPFCSHAASTIARRPRSVFPISIHPRSVLPNAVCPHPVSLAARLPLPICTTASRSSPVSPILSSPRSVSPIAHRSVKSSTRRLQPRPTLTPGCTRLASDPSAAISTNHKYLL